MSLSAIKLIYSACWIIAAILAVMFIILYYTYDIRMIIAVLSGEKQKEEIRKIREENRRKNNSFVNELYKPVDNNLVYDEDSRTTYLNMNQD